MPHPPSPPELSEALQAAFAGRATIDAPELCALIPLEATAAEPAIAEPKRLEQKKEGEN